MEMPDAWNRFQERGFPVDYYDKEIPMGEYDVVLDASCYSKSSSRGTGVHLFARHGETDKKYWFYVFYLPGHPSYLNAKKVEAGERIHLVVQARRDGRGLVKNVIRRQLAGR